MRRVRRAAPDLALLKIRLSYDDKTGIFTWNTGRRAGMVAGCKRASGYISVYNGYYAHVLAWYYYYGKWPDNDIDIDHIDRVRSNNAIRNLRLATRSETTRNRSKWKEKCNGLPLGVHFRYSSKLPYAAFIYFNGANINLGNFDSIDKASAAYIKASRSLFGEF